MEKMCSVSFFSMLTRMKEYFVAIFSDWQYDTVCSEDYLSL